MFIVFIYKFHCLSIDTAASSSMVVYAYHDIMTGYSGVVIQLAIRLIIIDDHVLERAIDSLPTSIDITDDRSAPE